MRLIDAIPVSEESRIAFVGAGGKSTAMFRLARQAQEKGIPTVLLSATTHLAVDQLAWADRHIVVNTQEDILNLADEPLKGSVLLTGEPGEDMRAEGLSLELISEVDQLARKHQAALLVEADGSRMRPLKAPADHEPVLPSWVEVVVVVAGMSGLGQKLTTDIVHRPHLFGNLSGLKPGEMIRPDGLVRVLVSDDGGLKGVPPSARRVALLNQCDNPTLAAQAKQMSGELLASYGQVVLSQFASSSGEEVLAVHRRLAGVVLAAGGSVRLGEPKQLLDWQGKPFVQVVAETALTAGLSPVVVVTGAYRQEVEPVLDGLPVRVLNNPNWLEGQASSVRAAVKLFSEELPEVYGALFFLVDQPQISVELARTLVGAYSESLSPIVAPMVDDRRGNPVLFDRSTFAALSQLEGDSGGRQVFSRFPIQYVQWLDARAGMDVDTMEDYQRLIAEN